MKSNPILFLVLMCIGGLFCNKIQAQTYSLGWVKQMAGVNSEEGTGIVLDDVGNVYVTGIFTSTTDFDPGAGVFNLTPNSSSADIAVAKYDPSGNFIWAAQIGGAGVQESRAITLDPSGNIYVTGYFRGLCDFDPGPGTFTIGPISTQDIFVLKLDNDGNFIWVKHIASPVSEFGNSIATDASGNVFVTGEFGGPTDFDPGAGVTTLTPLGSFDIFVLKLDTNGDFVFAFSLGGTGQDKGSYISVDASNNFYITGYYRNTVDFDPGIGTTNLTSVGASPDVFIAKFDVSANLQWAKGVGFDMLDEGHSVKASPSGDVTIAGKFRQTVDFDPGPGVFNLTAVSAGSIFDLVLDSSGDFISASARIGNTESDIGNFVAEDALGNLFKTGQLNNSSYDFDPGCGVVNLTQSGGDMYLLKLIPFSGIPSITSITPSNGSINESVTITGSNFSTSPPNNIVEFNGTSAVVLASTSTTITTSVPAGATTGKITVTIDCNTATSVNDFIVTTALLPTITSFTPTFGPIGTSVIITGTNFSTTPANNVVAFNGTPAVVTASTANSITTTVPVGATTGKISVIVDGNTATSTDDFTITTAQNFITQWNLATAGSGATQLSFGTATIGMVNYIWQEISTGSATGSGSWSGSTLTITGLPANATIRLQIDPTNFQRIIINNGTDRNRLTQVEQWGSAAWTSMQTAFRSCANLQITAIDIPDLSGVTNISQMFQGCSVLNSPSNINGWNTATVTNMSNLFADAVAFNQNIGAWNTAAVTNMAGMFMGALMFNQNISTWNTSAVTNMSRMFEDAFDFNQNIGAWNTSAVTNMTGMFIDAYAFNQNIGNWNTAAVTTMERMFDFATTFNQNIGGWNTAAVTDLRGMFADAGNFNQNIGAWVLNSAVSMSNMFNNSGLDCNNYSATLVGWSANPSTPNGRTLGAIGRQYGTDAVAARTNLTAAKGWTITGDIPIVGVCSPVTVPTITSFTPGTGPIGTSVIISGTNFSAVSDDNIVIFNGIDAEVTASTTTSITAAVPFGATTGLITVTVSGNMATSATDFIVTSALVQMNNIIVQDCDVQFTDSGGLLDYGSDEDYTVTFLPVNSTDKVRVSFLSFSTESCCDILSVYDGPNATFPLIATLFGNISPADITATSPGGELTFVFNSDGDVEDLGWEALVSCIPATPPATINISAQTF